MREIIKKILKEEKEKSNLEKILLDLGDGLEEETLENLFRFIKSYIQEKNFTVKFLNSCSTGFSGVRTKNQIIICSPSTMTNLGDFVYTIFHELRHEEQMTTLKKQNPLSEMDLEDFEKLYEKYWELEMDADKSAKEMIAQIILKLKIPIETAKHFFSLSNYISNYQMASNMVKITLRGLVADIKKMKQNDVEFSDIQDHPMVKKHLENLENFI